MSDFKFSCSACGQHILGDTSHSGMQISCPACQAVITVPQAPPPAKAPPALSIAGSQARSSAASASATQTAPPPPMPSRPTAAFAPPGQQKTSGLAIASLVCSLCSLVLCIGCLPGIICGHLALGSIRRNPSLKGRNLAMAGLVMGYLFLVIEIGICFVAGPAFIANFKKGYIQAREKQTHSQSFNPSGSSRPSSQTPMTEPDPPAQPDPLWSLNLKNASIPNHPAAGKIHGAEFTVEAAKLEGGNLTLRQGKDFFPDQEFVIPLFLNAGESLESRSFNYNPGDPSPRPLNIQLGWKENSHPVPKKQTISQGTALRLEFGKMANQKIPAKIYLCLPDAQKSYVAGTFEIPAPK